MISLILGGARSGKTRYAEQLALASERDVFYIATAEPRDEEMQARIQHHQAHRPSHWQTIEQPLALGPTLQAYDQPDRLLLVDCLTLWLNNLLGQEDEQRIAQEQAALLAVLPQLTAELILVSNEVGLGIIPLGALTRRYVDEAGRLHQALAAQADRVVLMVAGLPVVVKA